MGKYCSNLQCFFIKKTIKLNSQLAQYEKKKPRRTILEKKNHKKKKKNHIGKHCSNPQCFFFLNDKVKFSTSSILEKNKK
jgi:hypothetical protein